MTSLEQIFKSLGNSIKDKFTDKGITVANDAGFKTIMLKFFDLIDTKADADDVPTKFSDLTDDSEYSTRLNTLESNTQDTLVDEGTNANIKKINNTSLLGSGNIDVQTPLTEGSDYLNKTNLDNTYQPKGNYATLTDGKVPSSQLPSYVDDVIEGYYNLGKFYSESTYTTEITAETGKIYVDITDATTPKTYRYGGSGYVAITSGNIIVVDSVSDSNMNAVSSNAVHDELYTNVIGSNFESYMTA